MIIIFGDFCQFSAKKMAFFSKTNVMINFFSKTSSSLSKNANIFTNVFGENIFKIITSVPESDFSHIFSAEFSVEILTTNMCTEMVIFREKVLQNNASQLSSEISSENKKKGSEKSVQMGR
jgi:hypothetical protein